MPKKPSIGVIIFGWIVIITAVFSAFSLFDMDGFLRNFREPWGMIFYVTSFPLLVLELVLAIQVLRLQEWARKWLVILTIAYAVIMIITPFTINEDLMIEEMRRGFEQAMSESAGTMTPEQQASIAQVQDRLPVVVTRLTIWGFTLAYLIYYLILIFFFTRPKVKAQFAPASPPSAANTAT